MFRNSHPFFAGRIPQVPEWGEVCRTAAEARLAWLDGVLADRPFIAGERYTIADITALCGIDFGRVSKIRVQPEHTQPDPLARGGVRPTERQGVGHSRSARASVPGGARQRAAAAA